MPIILFFSTFQWCFNSDFKLFVLLTKTFNTVIRKPHTPCEKETAFMLRGGLSNVDIHSTSDCVFGSDGKLLVE